LQTGARGWREASVCKPAALLNRLIFWAPLEGRQGHPRVGRGHWLGRWIGAWASARDLRFADGDDEVRRLRSLRTAFEGSHHPNRAARS